MPIRIVLAEDDLLVREGLMRVLGNNPTIEVVSVCENAASLDEAIERDEPDVVVTDIRMPPTKTDEGIAVAAQLRERRPGVGVVVLSQFVEPSYALRLFESGSDRRAYLLKDRLTGGSQLVAAIEAVATGGSVVDPKVVEALVEADARQKDSSLSSLTPRELEVLAAIAEGKSNGAIAESLVVTTRAVEKHVNSIFLKLGLGTVPAGSKRVKAALLFLAQQHKAPSR